MSNKVVPVFAILELDNWCHVHVLDIYHSKLPPEALDKDCFYLQPLSSLLKDVDKPWFSITPTGQNTLAKIVKDICKDDGIAGAKTNHSLCATGTELFN